MLIKMIDFSEFSFLIIPILHLGLIAILIYIIFKDKWRDNDEK